MKTSIDEIKDFNPSGVFLSNGPGDPSIMHDSIAKVKKLLMTLSLFLEYVWAIN